MDELVIDGAIGEGVNPALIHFDPAGHPQFLPDEAFQLIQRANGFEPFHGDPPFWAFCFVKTFNFFFVAGAAGIEFIPAQTHFVNPFGIKSVIGFGGMLPSGNLFTIILFTKVTIPEATAQLFKAIPLNIKMAILSLDKAYTFCP